MNSTYLYPFRDHLSLVIYLSYHTIIWIDGEAAEGTTIKTRKFVSKNNFSSQIETEGHMNVVSPIYIVLGSFLTPLRFVCRASLVAWVPVFCHSSIHWPFVHPSFNSDFSETAAWIQATFCGKLPIDCIPRLFIFFSENFWFSKFLQICFLFVNMGLYGSQISKCYLSPSFGPISTKLYDKYVSHWGNTRFSFFWHSSKT